MSVFDYLWLFFILSSIQPMVQQKMLFYQRTRALRSLEKRNNSRAISLIHRREGLTFLGIPFGGYIDIEDSEAVIRAIELTGPTVALGELAISRLGLDGPVDDDGYDAIYGPGGAVDPRKRLSETNPSRSIPGSRCTPRSSGAKNAS